MNISLQLICMLVCHLIFWTCLIL